MERRKDLKEKLRKSKRLSAGIVFQAEPFDLENRF